ncbi:MAG: PAS domain S-box protein [Rhodanobacteraceae bacterium]
MSVANDIREGGEAVEFPAADAATSAGTFEATDNASPGGKGKPRRAVDQPSSSATDSATGAHTSNDRLLAVVQELQARNEELARANSELNNLIASTGVGTLFLDGELRILRYTPHLASAFELVPADVGRPFAELVPRFKTENLLADAQYALRDGVAVERESTGKDGRFYRVRMQPGRVGNGKVGGVALTFVDISERERQDQEITALNLELVAGKALAESIVATVREPMLVLDEDLRVVMASRAFYRDFLTSAEATVHESLYDLGDHQWDIPELLRLLDEVLPERTNVDAFEVRHDFGAGERIMLLSACRLRQQPGLEPLILLTFEDVTERTLAKDALAASESKYRDLFDSIDAGFCIVEMLYDDAGRAADLRHIEVNPAFARNNGLENVVGKTLRGDLGIELEQSWLDTYSSVAETGESIRFQQYSAAFHRWFDLNVFRAGVPELRRVAVLFTDTTERKRAERAVTRLASIVDTSDDAIISKDLDGVIISWNRGAEEMFGYRAEEARGHTVASLIIPGDRQDEEDDILHRIRRGEAVDHFETVRRHKDGSLLDVSVTISPLRDKRGRIIGASKIARDITDRKHYERHRELLIQELNHRVKNTLASVQALAAQTFRGSGMRDSVATFEARLLAMSAAHDVLTRQSWQGAGIREVVGDAVAAWAGQSGLRAAFDGPELRLRPAVALALAMALHELATNAVKYGALSNKKGKVSIEWSVSDDPRPCFRLRWLEQGGPPVRAPARRGFGSRLIEYGLARDLGGTVHLSFNEGGVECRIEAPLEEICEEGTV